MRGLLAAGAAALWLGGCAALDPAPRSIEARLNDLPRAGLSLSAPVSVRWNAQMVPWITAESDDDLAFALGYVHHHLRAAQIAILKRVAQGRLSEMAGPLAGDIDEGLRILGFGRAAPAVVAAWPDETRRFAERFVTGMNAHMARTPPPPEFALLGIRTEPYTAEDLVTIGRLAGTDVNWLTYLSLLSARSDPRFAEIFARTLNAGASPTASFEGARDESALRDLLAGFSRSGSNTVVVAPERSQTGAALIASDPHLGLTLPNLWLLAGIRSPSYHAVGLMVPGLPFIALGRTPHLAWGGTNMRAAVSDLYDVGKLDDPQVSETHETIATRFWLDRQVAVRVSALGPVLSDAALIPAQPGETIALDWIGHRPTDEITALLRAARARDAVSFREALRGFAVSPQNMLFATADGDIGQVLAVVLPERRYDRPPGPVLDPRDPAQRWAGTRDVMDLPAVLNPDAGFIASANNRPADAPVPVGFYFSDDERVRRLQALLADDPSVSVADLMALQRDVTSPDAAELAAALAGRLTVLGGAAASYAAGFAGWDGAYGEGSQGAAAFELLLGALVPRVYGAAEGETPGWAAQWTHVTEYLLADLDALAPDMRACVLREAVAAAAPRLAAHPRWGDLNRIRAAHVLAQIPVIGGAFVYDEFPAAGSRETVLKAAHGLATGPGVARYGSQARHVSDMSDPDANWFVLWGGSDGWLGSAAFRDQIALWRAGAYVQMPLSAAAVAAGFPVETRLMP